MLRRIMFIAGFCVVNGAHAGDISASSGDIAASQEEGSQELRSNNLIRTKSNNICVNRSVSIQKRYAVEMSPESSNNQDNSSSHNDQAEADSNANASSSCKTSLRFSDQVVVEVYAEDSVKPRRKPDQPTSSNKRKRPDKEYYVFDDLQSVPAYKKLAKELLLIQGELLKIAQALAPSNQSVTLNTAVASATSDAQPSKMQRTHSVLSTQSVNSISSDTKEKTKSVIEEIANEIAIANIFEPAKLICANSDNSQISQANFLNSIQIQEGYYLDRLEISAVPNAVIDLSCQKFGKGKKNCLDHYKSQKIRFRNVLDKFIENFQ